MKQPLNEEFRRMQKLAGIIKEEISPEKIEFKGTDGVLQIKLYVDKSGRGVSIFEACFGDKQIFCIEDSTTFLKRKFNKIKTLESVTKHNYATGEDKEHQISQEELSKMKCEEIFHQLFNLYLSGNVYSHHGGKTQRAFKCGDFSQGFGRSGY